MSTIAKIAVLVALIAGLVSLALTFAIKPKQNQLKSDLITAKQNAQAAQANLAAGKKDLATAKQALDVAKTDLSNTKNDLETAKADREKAVAAAAEADAKAKDLAAQVATQSETIAKSEEASKAAGASVPELKASVDSLKEKIAASEGENKTLSDKVKQQEQQIAQLTGAEGKVVLPSGLRGKVLVYEKNWNFVVVDVGRKDGAIQNGEMDVYRNTKFIGKVKLTAVNTHLAIANVLSQWSQLEIKEGDMVMPAS